MPAAWIVLIAAAVLAAGACAWVLHAYRSASDGDKPRPALLVCAVAGLGALALYLFVGRPDLPDAPFAQRLAALRQRDPMTYTVDEALAILDEASKAHPEDARPHLLTGQLLLGRNQPELAARAFDAALRRDPNSPEAMLGMGQALVANDAGAVSPQALRLFQAAAARNHDPTALVFEAKAALQAGQDPRPFWNEALAQLPAEERGEAQRGDWRVGLGRALVRVEGQVSPEALHLFEQAGAASRDPTPWLYQAMAAMQAGRDARHFWAEALARLPANDPRRAMAERMSAAPAPNAGGAGQ